MALITTTRNDKPLYRVRWNYQRDPITGKRKFQERSFRNRREALEFDKRVNAGTSKRSEQLTVSAMLIVWREAHESVWQLRTRKDYEQHANLRINPYLGSKRVSSVTNIVLADWRDWMQVQGHQTRVVNKSIQTLKTANRWARGRGLSQNAMIDDAPLLKGDKPKPPRPLTPSQVQTLIESCELHRDAALIATAAYTGLRWSELRGLQWGDINWTTRSVFVQRSIDRDLSVKAPKSGSERHVPILRPGFEALTAWRDASEHTSDTDWVFPAANGKPLFTRWYRDSLDAIRETSGIHFDPHELRDTYASILIASGINEGELTLWLGHASFDVTLKRYAQLYAARRVTMASQADAIIPTLG